MAVLIADQRNSTICILKTFYDVLVSYSGEYLSPCHHCHEFPNLCRDTLCLHKNIIMLCLMTTLSVLYLLYLLYFK